MKFAQVRETLPPEEIRFIVDAVYDLPGPDGVPSSTATIRSRRSRSASTTSRSSSTSAATSGLPVALEGALKLKEISYIPTEAYSAGEMKHGPIALLETDTPVVVVATNLHVYDKIVSNIQETRARGAHVIAIATDGNEDIQHHADDVIYVPSTPHFLQAVLAVAAAAAAGLPDRAPARAERRPAAQPGQDRYRRVDAAWAAEG